MNELIFGGEITTQQLVIIACAVICVILALTLAKKVAKIIVSAIVVIIALVYCGVVSPDQITELASFVSEQGVEVIQEVANHSDNIRIDTKDGVKVEISNDGETWYDISTIDKVIISESYAVILTDSKESVKFEDEYIVKLLGILKEE